MDREGAMQLGVSTIVILVIAMVIIGSAISFIRTFFAQGEDRLTGAFPPQDCGADPDSTNQFVLCEGKEITVTQDETTTLKTAVYNTDATTTNYSLDITSCINKSGGSVPSAFTLNTPSEPIDPSTSSGLRGPLNVEGATAAGSEYTCRIRAVPDGSGSTIGEQATIEVVS